MSRRGWVGGAALTTLILGVVVGQLRPGAGSWLATDDVVNLRWVLEHWQAPWFSAFDAAPLAPLHALTLWLATPRVGDPWLPQWAALTALRLVALLGFGALAARLGARSGAALVVMLLGATLPGLLAGPLYGLGAAGALAFGSWALALFEGGGRTRALVAAGLALGAVLYGPAAWIVLPIAALASASRRGAPWTHTLPFAALGVLGIVLGWPPHVGVAAVGGPIDQLARLPTLAAAGVSGWPVGTGSSGLPSTLALAALWLSLPLAGPVRAGGWALTTLAGLLFPPVTGASLLVLAGVVVALRRRTPPLGLVLYLAHTVAGLVLTVDEPAGALGLALHTVLTLAELPRTTAWRVGVGLGALQGAIPVVGALLPAPPTPPSAERERLLGWAALVSAMGPSEAVLLSPARPSDPLLPMTGMFERDRLAQPAAVSVGDDLLLNPPPDAVERNLQARSRVAPSSVPWLGESWKDADRLQAGDHPRGVAPGWYAIGLAPAHLGGRTFGSALHAVDGCGNRWVAASPAPEVAIGLEVVHLRPECPGLALAWTGERRLEANFILAPLTGEPVLSAGRGQPVRPRGAPPAAPVEPPLGPPSPSPETAPPAPEAGTPAAPADGSPPSPTLPAP